MSDEIKALVAKLTAKQFTGRRTLGGGTISHDGTSTMWGNEPIMELRNPDGPEAAAALTAQADEIERLRKLTLGQWFYPPDNYDQERCMWSPDEVIDYCDLEPGHHVIEVNVATPLPSIWCTVHVTSDEDADERFTFTEHATEDQARAALKAAQEVKA